MHPHLMLGFSDYIQALESERRKIHVFSKELPLSLELVTQAIEACRLQLRGRKTSEEQNLNRQSECSSGQTSSEGPVLEFIPLKKRPSSDCGEEDEEENEQHSHKLKIAKDNNNNTDKKKSDWLRSVQLWNPQSPVKEGIPSKTSVSELNRDGGAFRPFHREASVGKTTVLTAKASSSPAPAHNKREEKEGHNNNKRNKQRRCWSQELHKRFVNALQQLGGADSATPKQIRELMKVDGLTNDEVKSHLQKFRLHTKRPSLLIQNNNGDSQAAPFVIVGNFIVGPPEHAAAVPGNYAPVTSDAAAVAREAVPTKGQGRQLRSNSEDSEVADHTNSPTSSSSTHTTTASPRYKSI